MVDENAPDTATNAEITYKKLDDAQLRGITDMQSAAALFGGQAVHVAEVLGNGFSVLDEKSHLCDVEMMVVQYGQHVSAQTGGTFSTLHAITVKGDKFIVNDGSTGIHEQCIKLEEEMPGGGWLPLLVPRGLRVSEYDIQNDDGGTQRARTFYLNTSK